MKLIFAILLFSFSLFAATETDGKSPRLLRHLLDYIAADYSGAVQNGKVVSKSEYDEQIEFIRTAMSAAAEVPELKDAKELQQDLGDLKEFMEKKGDAAEVAKRSRRIGEQVIQIAHIEVAPQSWPDLHQGRAIYEKNCTSCHGGSGHGDGPSGGNLDPKPADFHAEKMDGLPPFQMFNTIRLGVQGTGMAGFPTLSDQEVWDVAFYILSLRHGNGTTAVPTSVEAPPLSLKDAATKSDADLREIIQGSELEKRVSVSKLRLHSEAQNSNEAYIFKAQEELRLALQSYKDGKYAQAKNHAIVAYLDHVEPIEAKLRVKDATLTQEMETRMSLVRAAIDSKSQVGIVEERVLEANTYLNRCREALQREESSPWFTFSVAAGIFMREAFEAALILITLLGVIRSVGSTQAALYVHAGWISALLVGLSAWFFSGWLVQISGAQREMLEGVISLFAVIVLLYFGFWLHRKTEIGKWQAFIKEMVTAAVDKKNLFALGVVAFMGVFREAFETVLFLRALLIETGTRQSWALGAGVLSSFVLVLVLSTLIVRYSARIPVRRLFNISAGVMAVLAVVLIGKSIHSFQETGLVGVTPFPIPFHSDLFGIYPTLETFLPQIILAILVTVGLLLGKDLVFKNKNLPQH